MTSKRASARPRARARVAAVALGALGGAVVLGGVAFAALGLAPQGGPAASAPALPTAHVPTLPGGADAPSNILPEDYVGPDACASCHKKNYKSWLEHPHRRMNQLASDETVLGEFDGRVVESASGTARFDHPSQDTFLMTLEAAGAPRRVYRITRTIGSRLKQYYVGVLVEGAPVGTNASDDEVVTPFGFWIHEQRWAPISYFEPYGDDIPGGGSTEFGHWPKDMAIRKVCVYCHNTYAYLHRLASPDLVARGFAPDDITLDGVALRAELARHVDIPPSGDLPLEFAPRFPLDSQILTVGISCESCHFGARAHAEDDDDYRFGPSSPHLALEAASPAQSSARVPENPWLVKGICRQCHSASVQFYPDGSAMVSSAEALELDAGACASEIACTSCHNPHRAGPKAGGGGADDPRHLAACTGCHAQFEDRQAAQRHAAHRPEDASCLDCHMPRSVGGIARTVRSHRISTPVDPRMLAAAAPNACNFCHSDRSPAWTLSALERLWDRHIEPEPAWAEAWGGSLDTPAAETWAASQSQHTKLFVAEVLSRRRDADSLDKLLRLLDDPAGTTRNVALMALERRLGRRLAPEEMDIAAPPQSRTQHLARLRAAVLGPQ